MCLSVCLCVSVYLCVYYSHCGDINLLDTHIVETCLLYGDMVMIRVSLCVCVVLYDTVKEGMNE